MNPEITIKTKYHAFFMCVCEQILVLRRVPKVGEKEVGRKIIHKMERNTKVLILTGPSNCGKTITLGKVSEYLQQEKGYTCLSHKVFGGKMNDISDLLLGKDGKLVYIMSEGDYQRDLKFGGWFVVKDICDVYIGACTEYFTKDLYFLQRQPQIFKKTQGTDENKFECMNQKDVIDIVSCI